jgi:hypothetical protein
MIHSPLLQKISGVRHGFGTIADVRPENAVTVRQVHGVKILEPEKVTSQEPEGYDTVLTDRPGIAVAVKTADCQPILLVEPSRKIVAAVHAGWKGTLGRAVQVAIRRIEEKGGLAKNLVCALGPNMVVDCFEVEKDVAAEVESEFPGWPILSQVSDKKWRLDVSLANRLQLKESGVPGDQIDRVDLCTHCRADLFWSFRRDGDAAGRMINFIEIMG